jgi:hypothetical protein
LHFLSDGAYIQKRLTKQPRRENMIGLKILAIAIIFTALMASISGGALNSLSVKSTLDQRQQPKPTTNPTIDTQTGTQGGNTSSSYQIPSNATKQSTNSSTSHASHHPSGSESMTAQDMYDMMESMDMYTQMQSGTMDAIMEEMMSMMVEMMSDKMKGMMFEMMAGNMTQNGMVNQTLIQEMDKMLQTMDNSLTILNLMANSSITDGEVSSETMITIANSINQIMTMTDRLMQLIEDTTNGSSSMATMSSVDSSNSNPPQLNTDPLMLQSMSTFGNNSSSNAVSLTGLPISFS